MTWAPPSTLQSMVFGNKGELLGHRRRASRATPPTARTEFYGDYLVNAQGEDVVAGIRNTSPIAELKHVDRP